MTGLDDASLKVDRSARTLRELSLEKMREAIWGGRFEPGERLVERTLCERLDVSRSIVREVLRHLETEGLVESIPHQGPVVATLTASQAAQIYELRGLLEGRAAAACARHADDAAIARLGALNDRIQQAFARGEHREVLIRTSAFYEALFEVAGMSVAAGVVRSLNSRINRLRAMTIAATGRSAEAATEMGRMIEAIRARDEQGAREASESHVRRVAEIALARLPAAR